MASVSTSMRTSTRQFDVPQAAVPEQWRTANPSIPAFDELSYGDVHNPARPDELVGRYARCGVGEVTRAVAAAKEAFPAWRDLGARGRAALMLAGAKVTDELVDLVAPLLTLEIGKTLGESRGDAGGAGRLLREYAAHASVIDHELDIAGEPGAGGAAEVVVRRVPLGPVAVISPWNTPIHLAFTSIAPALVAGNTVVVKPSEVAPLGLTALLTALAAVLPDGVLQVVPGDGVEAGAALTSNPDIRGVFFTGGIVTGREVIKSSAPTVKNIAMELGGNDPALILESAAIDEEMVRELVAGSFGCAGQICFNVKRIYVHRKHFDKFVSAFTDLAGKIVVGDGFDPLVDVGPLTTEDGYRRANRLIDQARGAGATVQTVGRYADSARPSEGYYVLPTVVTGIAADDELVVTEQFCPVIPIMPFDSDEEAISAANETDFGLASSVWSKDIDHAMRVARRIESGSTFINVHRLGASVPSAPFGGIKQSGIGRTHGAYSLRACTEEHAIVRFGSPTTDLPGMARWSHLQTATPTATGRD
ncbi:hypothetical protein CH253_17070 [Rhodococcus sp. 06-156-3C]|nr:hypothetical protein CH280_06395 [Rhodococcus sp. 06-156-4C]OZD18792.1 hypothetical protein CH253_17070 [Rhodococcus sp. 06-156-3C]OZD22302.1 hypothetical protein CH248_08655 [Rhodococcus sp. 06-156-4a]OZD34108.1 hypothetical protein CH247_08480 [Rhodococcus sp. 06-156-3b]OZD38845.1 hypothetical protein CH284_06900 [Rhodococcus sp. 06-156-3]OZF57305.1 hypothetical protein CH290_27685 [Rhodococcus sp. 06-156-4]